MSHKILMLTMVSMFSLAAVLHSEINAWPVAAVWLVIAYAVFSKHYQALHPGLIFALLFTFQLLSPDNLSVWPFRVLLPLLAYAGLVMAFPQLRSTRPSMPKGSLDRKVWALIVLISILSSIALVIWFLWIQPDMKVYVGQAPLMPLYVLPLAGIGFSLLNAAMEEVIFRGVLMEALDSVFGRGAASLLIQGMAFGVIHYAQGFPNGLIGALLASIFGLMLGFLRRLSGGLLAPWICHVLVDITIFTIIAFFFQT